MRDEYDDVDDFLSGTGIPSASFLERGTNHQGIICEKPKKTQQLDMDTREPKFWPNGDPMMQLVVTIQTDERDDEIEDDDGRRRFYIKSKMREAVAKAIKDAGEKGLREGGWLSITWVSSEKPKKRGHNGLKNYEAEYEAPDPSDYLNEEDPDDEGEAEPEPPRRRPAKAAAKKAPAKAAGRRPARREPEPEEDDGEEYDEPEPPRRRAAKKAPAKAASSRTSRRRPAEDDGDYEDDTTPF